LQNDNSGKPGMFFFIFGIVAVMCLDPLA